MPLEIGREELLKFQKWPRGKIIGFSLVYLPLKRAEMSLQCLAQAFFQNNYLTVAL